MCSRSSSGVCYRKRDARPAKREESAASAAPSEPVAPLRFIQPPPPPQQQKQQQQQQQYMKQTMFLGYSLRIILQLFCRYNL